MTEEKQKKCMTCDNPAAHKLQHCPKCLEAITNGFLERRGGVKYVPFFSEGA